MTPNEEVKKLYQPSFIIVFGHAMLALVMVVILRAIQSSTLLKKSSKIRFRMIYQPFSAMVSFRDITILYQRVF